MTLKFLNCCCADQSQYIIPYTLLIRDKDINSAYFDFRYKTIRFLNWFFFLYHIVWFLIKFIDDTKIFMDTAFPKIQIVILLLQMILQAGSYKFPILLWLVGPLWYLIHCLDRFIDTSTEDKPVVTLLFKMQVWFIFFNTQWILQSGIAILMVVGTMVLTSEALVFTFTETLFLLVTIYINYHLEKTYKESHCEKFVSQRNLMEFKGMLNNLKDGIFIARKNQGLKVDYINRAAKILLSQNPVDLETGLLQGHSQAQQLAMQGQNPTADYLMNQDLDKNEEYAEKKCFVRYDVTNLNPEQKNTMQNRVVKLLNLKDILALQQEDFTTAQSFKVQLPNSENILVNNLPQNNNKDSQQKILIVAIEIQNIIFQGEESLIIYIHNISQLTENQRLKQVSQSQELLQATVSHELRTPLNCILLMVQLLQGRKLSKQENYFARQIQVSSNLLLCYVNDLLDFNQIKNGIFNPIVMNFNFKKVLDDVLQIFSFQAKAQDTLLMYNLERSIPQDLRGDKTRLQQVLINLIKNALKFTHGGFIKVKSFYLHDTSMLNIQIIDNGKGIKEEERKDLFRRFGKLQRTADINQEGIGLGLTICKELCTKNGGQISVESQGEGHGSTFTFSMKMEAADLENEVNLESMEFKSNDDKLNSTLNTQVFEGANVSLSQIIMEEPNEPLEDDYTQSVNPWAHQCPALFNGSNDEDVSAKQHNAIGPNLQTSSFQRAHVSAIEKSKKIIKSVEQINLAMVQEADLNHQSQPTVPVKTTVKNGDSGKQKVRSKKNYEANILAVDDSTFNLEALQLILNIHFKVECETAVSGKKSLAMVDERLKSTFKGNLPYKLIFMDYSMPQMNGLETAEAILKLYRNYNQKEPIICCLTAYTEDNFRVNALKAGMKYFVTKPADQKSIGEILKLID